jgi:hypothetical protein
MPTVDFMIPCYWKDAPKLHEPNVVKNMVAGHNYPFNKVLIVHQNCAKVENNLRPIIEMPNIEIVKTEDSPNILTEFGIPENDPDADIWTHGPTSPHYWKWHVINHLNALKASKADYFVCTDSDVTMVKNGPPSWIERGIEILNKYPKVLVVSPDEGGAECSERIPEGRLVQTMSQQIFICNRERLSKINFNIPYDSSALYSDPSKRKSTKLAPFGPMQEFYFMLEGRIWRWLDNQGLYRLMLPSKWRYWHWQGKIGGK